MRKSLRCRIVAVIMVAGLVGSLTAAGAAAQEGMPPLRPFGESGNHYVSGVEGIKGASIPPAGLYARLYNVFYTSDKLNDADGNELPLGLDLTVYAPALRVIWISDLKFAGADFGMDAVIPFVYTDIEIAAAGVKDDAFELADAYFEPCLLAWHGAQYDVGVGVAFWFPTGEADEPASPGKDYWTTMLTAGSTWYPDSAKTWSASILARYEMHTEQDDADLTLGDDFHFEWGVGKTVGKAVDVGIAGYCQWQVSDDSGSDVIWDKSEHDQVYAIGPDVQAFCPKMKVHLALRTLWEFEAKDRTEGQLTQLTLTKIF